MKKVVIVTKVNNYRPDLCEYTIPNLSAYAQRIGADFIKITDRKFPAWHPAYEKLQAYEIAADYDKTLLIDADIALHPNLPDLTEPLAMHNSGSWMQYPITSPTLTLWDTKSDPYFLRDGRNIGVVSSLVGCTRLTRDIFKPLPKDANPEEIQGRLYRVAIVDEYTMSLNVAKYGLKHVGIWGTMQGIFHAEVTTKKDRTDIERLKQIIQEWNHG